MTSPSPPFTSDECRFHPDPIHPRSDRPSQNSRFNPMNLFNVTGLVVVVTGGGTGEFAFLSQYVERDGRTPENPVLIFQRSTFTGIGLMMATALENNGATVYIIGRRGDMLKKAAADNNASRISLLLMP